MSIKPSIVLIDDASTANNIYQIFSDEQSSLLYEPGYYRYHKSLDNKKDNDFAIRCGHYPDFTNPNEIELNIRVYNPRLDFVFIKFSKV